MLTTLIDRLTGFLRRADHSGGATRMVTSERDRAPLISPITIGLLEAPRVLLALSLLTGCATTPTASEPRINLMRPSECLTACPQLPAPTDRDELAVTLWTLDLIDVAAECRRMHEVCRRAKD